MKLKILICFAGLLIAAQLLAQSTQLRVMTYNLRFGELASLEEMATYIRSKQPDLVALQECDWKTTRARAPKQAGKAFVNELAYHSGLFGIFGKAINYAGGYYGVGILSRYPILRSERVLLPNPEPAKEQRVMLIAEIELPDHSVVTFISTHLEVSSDKARTAQIEFINEKVKELKTPVILAGDFNAIPSSTEIKSGMAQWFAATDTNFTYASTKPEIKIDYIYGLPANRFNLLETRTDSSCMLSDHFPVLSVLELKKKSNY